MPRSEQREAALRLCLATVGWVLCVLLWLCLLSYSVADAPNSSVWTADQTTYNLGGSTGAAVAHVLISHLGLGAYALAGMLTLGLSAWTRRVALPDLWIRLVGAALMICVFATAGSLLPQSRLLLDWTPPLGAGGALGIVLAHFLTQQLGELFTVLLLACAFLVALLLAADELFFGVSRGLAAAGRRSAPMLARSSEALASASAAMLARVNGVTDRMARAAVSTIGGVGATLSAEAPPLKRERSAARGGTGKPRGRTPSKVADEDEDASEVEELAAEVDDSAVDVADEAEVDGDELVDSETEPADDEDEELEAPATTQTRGHTQNGHSAAGRPKVIALGESPPPARKPAIPQQRDDSGYKLPDYRQLEDAEPIDRHAIEHLCQEKAKLLEETLQEFRLEVRVVAISTGPVITVFELKLAPGIKVSQIASLTNDIARALKAPAVRVVAPLPGKNTIGIEVPNLDKEKVRLRELLLAPASKLDQQAIPLFLGKDANGQPLVSDLTRMPHLLIAGTTGSGKSVCVSSIIMSILLTRTPSQVQLILVDPKVVELAMFKDIPHLMCPIVTEMSKAEAILDWAATKMDERYALLAEAGVKDLNSYNRLGEAGLRERMQIENDEELAKVPLHMPYIVIVIDELADLMMTSAKEVEFYLCRLAQKSRAVGIHLIVSTQRPQANVVTGLIKANLPCRIAFRVASRLDSRIVLDQNGGELLMGQGDMMFLPPGSSKLVRAQGTYIADDELRGVVKHCRSQGQPNYHPELIRTPRAAGEGGERDELFDEAVDIIMETGRGSVSLLQRRLTIGYGRASRLIDQMYDAGIVGEYKGSQAREVVITRDEWNAIRNQRDSEEAAERADE